MKKQIFIALVALFISAAVTAQTTMQTRTQTQVGNAIKGSDTDAVRNHDTNPG